MTLLNWKAFGLNWLHKRWPDVLAIVGMVLFFIGFFPQALFGGRYLLTGDSFFYSYPMHKVAWDMLRHGNLPLWSPYTLSGYPLLAMAQLGLGYPLTWGHLFLPGHIAEQLYVLAPFLLGPIFTYLYVRALGRSPLAAMLAGLSFGYGGMMASPLGNSGMMTNATVWLPLFLLAVERARTRSFLPSLLLATGAYTMSVLNGFGQGFLYVGLLAFAYSVFIVLTKPAAANGQVNNPGGILTVQRWRPVIVAAGAGMLAAGVAAFQILETGRVVRRSIRQTLSFASFTQGSFSPSMLWKSFLMPLFYTFDMHAYVPPLVFGLAIVAVWSHSFGKLNRDPRVFFYLGIAVLALLLMLGEHTPLYLVVFHLPIINRFRVPSRHTFEWTFAASVLAAYGWDAIAAVFRKQSTPKLNLRQLTPYGTIALLVASVAVGFFWWVKIQTFPSESTSPYLLWKGGFVLVTLSALISASRIDGRALSFCLLAAVLLVVCYAEPSALVTRWWGHGFDASRFSVVSDATGYLKQFPPEQGRVYTRTDLSSEQYGSPPRFDAPNFSAVSGLQNVAGYEPLIMKRYSRALGDVGLDAVTSLSNGNPDQTLLESHSHVLDLLNTTFIVTYPNLKTALRSDKDAVNAQVVGLLGEIRPKTTLALSTTPTTADTLELVTSLSNSTAEPDGTVVAHVRILTDDGPILARDLQAGRDTAEWAHERADVRPFIKHKLATVFDEGIVDGPNPYPAYRFKTVIKFDRPLRVRALEVDNVSKTASLAVYNASLVDSRSQTKVPLSSLYSDAWRPVYEKNDTLILRNDRAQPRAWLVAAAESVDGEEALARIRGESKHSFDPRLTALLEVAPNELPALPGGEVAKEGRVRISAYEPNRLVIDTDAPTSTLLVVSEMFYPGWEATLDGQPTKIYLTNFLLRGFALPAGQHRIEMRYAAPAARHGAIISTLTLSLIAGLTIYARRTHVKATQTGKNDLLDASCTTV